LFLVAITSRLPDAPKATEGCRGQYEDALKELLKKKQSGEEIEAPREREPSKVVNLMDALRRSVESERGGGERRKSARVGGNHRTPKKAGRLSARAKKAS
jgi:DNA end-binding protein Ku